MRCFRQPTHNLMSRLMLAWGQVLLMCVLRLQYSLVFPRPELNVRFIKEADPMGLPLCISFEC